MADQFEKQADFTWATEMKEMAQSEMKDDTGALFDRIQGELTAVPR
jgi:hypothetical protein